VYVVIALYKERFAMLGLLVTKHAFGEPLQPNAPLLPAFLRRALAALFRRR
jgi:hypothetical protein